MTAAQDEFMPPDAEEVEKTDPEVSEDAQAESAPAATDESDKVQIRINKVIREKGVEQRGREAAEKRVAELEAKLAPTEPKLEDYDYDEGKHQDALITYKVQQQIDSNNSTQQANNAEQELAAVQETFTQKANELASEKPDFWQAVNSIPDLPNETLQAVMKHDLNAEIAYHLGKHLDIADQIATLNPVDAAIKIGQIAAGLSAPRKQQSAAPEPVTPISQTGAEVKSTEDQSLDEMMAGHSF